MLRLKKDTLVGIAGTLLLVLAMVGVFRFEAAQGGGSAWTVTWESRDVDGPGLQGDAQVGSPVAEALRVEQANVTRARFALAWTDDVGGPDTFNLTVTSPAGVTRSAEGDAGSLEVVFENLAVAPETSRVLGASQADVEQRVARDYSTAGAVGAWNVTVTLVSAGGENVPVAGVPVQGDNFNEWALATTLTAYEARVAR